MDMNFKDKKMSSHIIWSNEPAHDWAEGYPIGNGRLGGMVLGHPLHDRVSLNHDRLWRRFWKGQKHNIAVDMPHFKQLCSESKWNEAFDFIKGKVPQQGKAIYVNPFAPLGDLGIYPHHFGDSEITAYCRCLDMDSAVANVRYSIGGLEWTREYFASLTDNIIAVNISCSRAARVSGEVCLYRMAERECRVIGSSSLDEIVLQGEYEEGVRFAGVVKVINRGGRLTSGISEYKPFGGESIQKNRPDYIHKDKSAPHWFRFRTEGQPSEPYGVSTCFDSTDEITLLISMATDREETGDIVGYCRKKLELAGTDYQRLKDEHIRRHQRLYRRSSISLCGLNDTDSSTSELLAEAGRTGEVPVFLHEQLFNFGRYIAIASGYPAGKNEPYKAPINLQGIWNQDFRPAWDSDYHLDLNLQMCYWPLPMANLTELTEPLVDWAFTRLGQAREVACDIYGVGGVCYTCVADAEHLGNFCDLIMMGTGVSAWLGQILWLVWEYSNDIVSLKHKIYPILLEMGQFYEEFLTEDDKGRLVTIPSASPEICPVGRNWEGCLSSMSTFDIELIRELFSNLIEASTVLDCDEYKRSKWQSILAKLPHPTLNKEGRLLEWLDDEYEVTDPGHRHRSHLVSFCPGDRITAEDTPEYNEGVRKALAKRHSYGRNMSCSIDKAWDAQILARLYEGGKAIELLNSAILVNTIDNLLMSICDWRDRPGSLRWFGEHKVFQIEASLGTLGAITEMIVQDRRGLLRLFPALPPQWPDGHITGVNCRGGFTMDIVWKNSKLVEASITSNIGNVCRIKCFTEQEIVVYTLKGKVETSNENGVIKFNTIKGQTYLVWPLKQS